LLLALALGDALLLVLAPGDALLLACALLLADGLLLGLAAAFLAADVCFRLAVLFLAPGRWDREGRAWVSACVFATETLAAEAGTEAHGDAEDPPTGPCGLARAVPSMLKDRALAPARVTSAPETTRRVLTGTAPPRSRSSR
jgi:hypothetical protein